MTWEHFFTAFMASLPALAAAVLAFWKAWQNQQNTVELKHEMNSRLTELVESVRAAAHALGKAEGIAQERKNPQSPTKGAL